LEEPVILFAGRALAQVGASCIAQGERQAAIQSLLEHGFKFAAFHTLYPSSPSPVGLYPQVARLDSEKFTTELVGQRKLLSSGRFQAFAY
jgi:hypothetical protein